ncbi:MAG: hypothetical protein Q9220_000216 [cf. Caloplaca sp. 1 TL-2023]
MAEIHHVATITVGVRIPLIAILAVGDHELYKPLFGLYLDIQKQLLLEDLEEKEVKGRWKRFVEKCEIPRLTSVRNRGEIAEGWYDPSTLLKAQASTAKTNLDTPQPPSDRPPADLDTKSGDDDDDAYGPALPTNPSATARHGKQSGPSIPNFQDLALQRESALESRQQSLSDLRHARKIDRSAQAAALEDLVPRAPAGTKDRQLERRADVRLANNQFASAKSDNTFADVPEADVMGEDDGGGIEGYKKQRREEERKKNEKELRREEVLRARRAEREERVQAYKEKEARAMEGLVALAKARFG